MVLEGTNHRAYLGDYILPQDTSIIEARYRLIEIELNCPYWDDLDKIKLGQIYYFQIFDDTDHAIFDAECKIVALSSKSEHEVNITLQVLN